MARRCRVSCGTKRIYVCTDVQRIARVSPNLQNVYVTHDGGFGSGKRTFAHKPVPGKILRDKIAR